MSALDLTKSTVRITIASTLEDLRDFSHVNKEDLDQATGTHIRDMTSSFEEHSFFEMPSQHTDCAKTCWLSLSKACATSSWVASGLTIDDSREEYNCSVSKGSS